MAMIDSSSYDRILKTAMREVEHEIVAQVERAFEGLPDDVRELPIIGGWPFPDWERAEQKQTAIAALRAKCWFKLEAPLWAQPLLLKAEECYPLLDNHPNSKNYRALLRGSYGLYLRHKWWDLAHAQPFEIFCADKMASPAPSMSL
jgi:hypothetical protein